MIACSPQGGHVQHNAGQPDRQRPGGFWAIGRAWWQHKVSLGISQGLTAAALLVYVLTFLGERPTPIFEFLQRLELDALDTRFRYRPRQYTHPDPRVIIVDIDHGSQEVLGRWPFSRSHFARLLDVLPEDGARASKRGKKRARKPTRAWLPSWRSSKRSTTPTNSSPEPSTSLAAWCSATSSSVPRLI